MSLVVLSKTLRSWGPRFNPKSGNYIPHTVNKSLHAVAKDPECMCMHAQPRLPLYDPMDCNPPGNSVHGILQARILEWVAISNSRGSSQPRDQIHVSLVSCNGRWILFYWTTRGVLEFPFLPYIRIDCHKCCWGWTNGMDVEIEFTRGHSHLQNSNSLKATSFSDGDNSEVDELWPALWETLAHIINIMVK